MNLVYKATLFATKKHAGQVRKASGAPYVTHPVAVSYIVAAHKRSKHLDELLAAAILHDTMEDTETSFTELAQEFTPLVASLVLELSNDPEQVTRLGKAEYQARKMCGMSSYGLVLKLADRLHNILDCPSEKMVQDTIALMSRLSAERKLSKTHQALVAAIKEACEGIA